MSVGLRLVGQLLGARLGESISPDLQRALAAVSAAEGSTDSVLAALDLVRALRNEGTSEASMALAVLTEAVTLGGDTASRS